MSYAVLAMAGALAPRQAHALPPGGYPDCEKEGRLASRHGTEPMKITFRDNLGELIHIYWLNYDGARVPYGELRDGEAKSIDTYAQHAWVITGARGNCVEIVEAGRDTREVVIPSGD
jgi:hypothetical protein